MAITKRENFSYESLSDETRIMVRQKTTEIRDRVGRAAQTIFEIGERLHQVRILLEHGEFLAWLDAEFEWSESAARKMMSVATSFKTVNFTDLNNIAPSALYLLASDSTPSEVRKTFVETAKSGERVTHKEVKEAISDAREESTPEPERVIDTSESQERRSQNGNGHQPAAPRRSLTVAEATESAKTRGETLEEKPPEPPPILDGLGRPVPEGLREVFSAGVVFDRCENVLRELSKQITILIGDAGKSGDRVGIPGGEVLAEKPQELRADAKNIWNKVKFSRPYAPCPYKHGRVECKACRGMGWVTKDTYDRAPEEVRMA